MPYITQERQGVIISGQQKTVTAGELTFQLTYNVSDYLNRKGQVRYADFAEVLGALEATKLEIYRRAIAPYEDGKIKENGDAKGLKELV